MADEQAALAVEDIAAHLERIDRRLAAMESFLRAQLGGLQQMQEQQGLAEMSKNAQGERPPLGQSGVG